METHLFKRLASSSSTLFLASTSDEHFLNESSSLKDYQRSTNRDYHKPKKAYPVMSVHAKYSVHSLLISLSCLL